MVDDGRALEKKPVLQNLQTSLVLNDAGRLFASIVLFPHRSFDIMESVVSVLAFIAVAQTIMGRTFPFTIAPSKSGPKKGTSGFFIIWILNI